MHPTALLVCGMAAYSIHEHQLGFTRQLTITLLADGFSVEDDGRGMGLHRPGYVENLMGTLVGGPGPVQLHGVGLSFIAASVAHLTVHSRREGQRWTQSFVRGLPEGPPTSEPAKDASTGTLQIARLAAGWPAASAADLQPQLDLWRSRHPDLRIQVLHDLSS